MQGRLSSSLPRPGARRRGDDGFTLLEVMVVVLVIGILLAVGIPTFLGARDRANDRSAQSTLRGAQNTALVIFTDDATFRRTGATASGNAEPGISYVTRNNESTDNTIVSVSWTSDGSQWAGAVRSDSGTCFYTTLLDDGPPRYGSSDTAPCTGNQALTVADPSW